MSKKDEKYLECGKIVNTHGIKGAIKLESWCDSPETLAELPCIYFKNGTSFMQRKMLSATVMKHHVVAYVEGVTDIDMAASLKETVVYADRDDIPLEEGDFFISDLVGLPVFDADSGFEYGTISDVFNTGASDIYTIKTADGERMIPAVPEFVIEIDTDRGVFVRPIEGMLD